MCVCVCRCGAECVAVSRRSKYACIDLLMFLTLSPSGELVVNVRKLFTSLSQSLPGDSF
jgi:hypothetical protein